MALRAHKLGVAGVVIDGRLRDLQEHRDLGFPVCYSILFSFTAIVLSYRLTIILY